MKNSQSGRSMVEILGVLGLIGILSIGGVVGYTTAMMKYKVNEILSGVRDRAVTISSYQGFQDKKAEDLLEYKDQKLKGYDVSLYDQKIEGSDFAIQIKNVDQKMCEQIASQGLESAVLVRPNLCDAENDNILIFGFKDTLQGRKGSRAKIGDISENPDESLKTSQCTEADEGKVKCNGYMSEKCKQDLEGNFYWTQKEMCLYGCSGGVCGTRDCSGNVQKCWSERVLLTCSNGQWQRDVTCSSQCSGDRCGEDCSFEDVGDSRRRACWMDLNGTTAKVYACKLDGNGRYTYSDLKNSCENSDCTSCLATESS